MRCPDETLEQPPDGSGARERETGRIGIVVPVHNEAGILPEALKQLQKVTDGCPVIVVDGGSTDDSAAIASRFFRAEVLASPNRGAQMNHGARLLDADVLLFLHADSRLPEGFAGRIRRALADPSVSGGCFRLRFDRRSPWLRFFTFWTRFRGRFFHFGDQAIFVRQEVFEELGGYREYPFMEDVDLLSRLRRRAPWHRNRFVVLDPPVVTSARRFERFGAVRQQFWNVILVTLFEIGVSPRRLARLYPHVR